MQDTVNAERADVVFPVTTIQGNRYAIFIRNQTLVVDKETETLPNVAVLLKAGFDFKFVTGSKRDRTFGGYLVTPDGQKIRMTFGDDLRLCLWSDPCKIAPSCRCRGGTTCRGQAASLVGLERNVEP